MSLLQRLRINSIQKKVVIYVISITVVLLLSLLKIMDNYISTHVETIILEKAKIIALSSLDEIDEIFPHDVKLKKSSAKLGGLREIIKNIKTLSKSYTSLISEDGTVILHSKEENLQEKELVAYLNRLSKTQDKEILQKIKSTQTRTYNLSINNEEYLVYGEYIKKIDSYLIIFFEKKNFLQPVQNLQNMLFISVLIALLLLLGILLLLSKRLTFELDDVVIHAKEIASGNFNVTFPANLSDEAANLADAMKYMQSSLKEYMKELKISTAKEEQIRNELLLANKIQRSFLPQNEELSIDNTLSLSGAMIPAYEVGGDFYGYRLQEEKIAFYIGDVSGKGIPASLFMMASHMMIENALDEKFDPSYVIERTNKRLSQIGRRGMFATLYVAVLNTKTYELTFCSAGHLPSILSMNGRLSSPLMNFFPPIGIFEELEYKNTKTVLQKDSKVVLFTDGITEAENKDAKFYGIENLTNMLEKLQNHTPSIIKNEVLKSVSSFRGNAEQNDDMTLFVLHVE